MTKLWSEVVNHAIELYKSKNVVYLYGAKMVLLTSEAQIREYFKREPAYFARYTEEEKAQIVRNSLGKYGADCSGFTGDCTGDRQYSIGQINNCSKYNSLQGGPTGSILFTTWGGSGRHIGLDVGNGLCMHIGWESTDKAIREGRAGILFESITARSWEKSGQSRAVNYSGSYSPYPPTTELWNSLHPEPKPTPVINGWVGEAYGAAKVPVYKNPTGTEKLSEYPELGRGNLFEVHAEQGGRWKIWIANKYYGWLDKTYCLRKTPYGTGEVKKSDLWLRTTPNPTISSNRICIMPKSSKVQLCDQKLSTDKKPWDYVIYNGQYGFCSHAYIGEV